MVKKRLSEEMFRDFLRVMPPYARQFADTLAPAEEAPAHGVIGSEAAPEANVDLAAVVRAVSEATGGTAVPPPLAGAALAEDSTGVFAAVQRRNNITWWASFLIIVVLAAILLGGVIGALITVLAGGASPWTALFGGISAVDLLTFILTRPEQALDRAGRKANQYELLFAKYQFQFAACLQQQTLQDRYNCTQQVWASLQQDINALDAVGAGA